MNKTPGKNPFWRILAPFLLYGAAQFVGRLITSALLIAFDDRLSDIYTVFTKVTTEAELDAAVASMIAIVTEEVLKYYVEITAIISLCTIPIMYLLYRSDRRREKEAGLPLVQKAKGIKYIWLSLLGIALNIGFNCLILMTNLAFMDTGYQHVSNVFYSASFFIQLIAIGIIAPISEELLFRGVVYKRLREITGFKSAAIYASVFFMFIHANILQMIYAFVLGMFFAYVYEKYGAFKAPVLLHITVNIVSLVCTEFKILDLFYSIPVLMVIIVVVCAFLAALMYIQIKKIEQKTEIESEVKEEHSI